MISTFNVEKLDKFLQSFYTAVGIRVSVFDDEFNVVCEYPKNPPAFCALVRGIPQGLSGCRNCDLNALREAKRMREPYLYVCHAGLIEAVAPIKVDGAVLGYIFLAHMLPEEDYQTAFTLALRKAMQYGLSERQLQPALRQIQALSHEKIQACVQILSAASAYLQVTDLVKWRAENTASQISKYIETHLAENINGDTLCKKFLISRTKLYQIATESYGTSISRYVTYKRIEKSKELLAQGLSISAVAREVGFADFNYFSKVFKKELGVSPSQYKKTI